MYNVRACRAQFLRAVRVAAFRALAAPPGLLKHVAQPRLVERPGAWRQLACASHVARGDQRGNRRLAWNAGYGSILRNHQNQCSQAALMKQLGCMICGLSPAVVSVNQMVQCEDVPQGGQS